MLPSTTAAEFEIEPIAAFRDNYFWLLSRGNRAAIVDPGAAAPVQRVLNERALTLEAILVTHHHADHTDGVAELVASTHAPVYAPAGEDIATGAVDLRLLHEGDSINILGTALQVFDVPGHTAGHIAYHAPDLKALFCGDTLFACGCGRLFEGTAAQMLDSLRKLARLPGTTRIYCAHEYTLSNLRFALAIEPANARLQQRNLACSALRARDLPTVPSTLEEELATNPFLRVDEPAVRAAAERRQPGAAGSAVATFAAIRTWKNGFN
jgi:hydroxyacylglutathione hydrolase